VSDGLTLDELLLGHAAGTLPEALDLVVRTHLALSPEGRRRYAIYRALGGALLETIEPVPLRADAWERLERALDRADDRRVEAPRATAAERRDIRVPEPLRPYAPEGFERLPWRNLGPAMEFELPIATPGYRARLIRLKGGKGIPRHTHRGHEITVVIEGSFRDVQGVHRRGDLVIADATVDHSPVADEDCLCLAVTDAPLKLTGPFGRLLNPILRI
jgi:putative transcriptional regulator